MGAVRVSWAGFARRLRWVIRVAYAYAADVSYVADQTSLGNVIGTMAIESMFDGDLSTSAKSTAT